MCNTDQTMIDYRAETFNGATIESTDSIHNAVDTEGHLIFFWI